MAENLIRFDPSSLSDQEYEICRKLQALDSALEVSTILIEDLGVAIYREGDQAKILAMQSLEKTFNVLLRTRMQELIKLCEIE